jgi:hypothetical protein
MVERLLGRLNSASGSLHQPDDVTMICATTNALGSVTHDTTSDRRSSSCGLDAVRRSFAAEL